MRIKKFTSEKFGTWPEFRRFYEDRRKRWQGWIFRGHADINWPLKTRLERVTIDRFELDTQEILTVEAGLIRRFQRQAHQYIQNPPRERNKIEWLALMQHHGAPTRLLDCTYSFYVAVFFALEFAKPGTRCAIWAFDAGWLVKRSLAVLPSDVRKQLKLDPNVKRPINIEKMFWSSAPILFVYPINPFRLNERLAVQQGVFLAPGNATQPFIKNLSAIAINTDSSQHVMKIEIDCSKRFLQEGLEDLYRMNVTAASLFPGLDGFARYLEMLVGIPETLPIDSFQLTN